MAGAQPTKMLILHLLIPFFLIVSRATFIQLHDVQDERKIQSLFQLKNKSRNGFSLVKEISQKRRSARIENSDWRDFKLAFSSLPIHICPNRQWWEIFVIFLIRIAFREMIIGQARMLIMSNALAYWTPTFAIKLAFIIDIIFALQHIKAERQLFSSSLYLFLLTISLRFDHTIFQSLSFLLFGPLATFTEDGLLLLAVTILTMIINNRLLSSYHK